MVLRYDLDVVHRRKLDQELCATTTPSPPTDLYRTFPSRRCVERSVPAPRTFCRSRVMLTVGVAGGYGWQQLTNRDEPDENAFRRED